MKKFLVFLSMFAALLSFGFSQSHFSGGVYIGGGMIYGNPELRVYGAVSSTWHYGRIYVDTSGNMNIVAPAGKVLNMPAPVFSTLTASKVVFTDASKALTSTGTVGVIQGGTGLASYAVGDILYASAATTIGKLADVAVGSVLISGGVGVAPSWSDDIATGVTIGTAYIYRVGGTDVAVADGGTGKSSYTTGDIVAASGATTITGITAPAVGEVLISAGVGTLPTWSNDLATGVTIGTAYIYRVGGTDVAVGDGGTGIGAYAIGDIIYASAADTLSALADVAAGSYLRSGGVTTAPVWSTLKLPDAATAYTLVVASATNTISELAAVGATGQYLSGVTGAIPAWATLNQAAVDGLKTSDSVTFASVKGTDATITNGTGTGLTVVTAGAFRQQIHKVTVDYTALAAAGLTADKVIAQIPAKTRLVAIYADTTVAYTGGGVTAATIIVGKSAGGGEYLASHDVLSGAVTVGLADADMGTEMTRAAAIQGSALVNWTAAIDITVRLTTVTQNTDQLTAGSTTYYIITERL
jgi:hypothetical protein